MGRCMRIVAVGTFPRFDRGMHGTAFQGFLKRLVTLQANFSFGPGFKFEFTGRPPLFSNNDRTCHTEGDSDRQAEIYID